MPFLEEGAGKCEERGKDEPDGNLCKVNQTAQPPHA